MYLLGEVYHHIPLRDFFVPLPSTHMHTHTHPYTHALQVTGVRGLMARSVVDENTTVHDKGVWHESSSEPGWKWKGDTSSDEVVGHMFAYPLVYDLVAEDNAMKDEVVNLMDDIIGNYIATCDCLYQISGSRLDRRFKAFSLTFSNVNFYKLA